MENARIPYQWKKCSLIKRSIVANYSLILVSALLLWSCNLYKIEKRTFTSENNGNTQVVGSYVHKVSKKFERYDYYQRWDNEYFEYYENGTLKSESYSAYKAASYGRNCREIKSSYAEYNEKGIRTYEKTDICDCKTSIEKTYDDYGVLVKKKVTKSNRKG